MLQTHFRGLMVILYSNSGHHYVQMLEEKKGWKGKLDFQIDNSAKDNMYFKAYG